MKYLDNVEGYTTLQEKNASIELLNIKSDEDEDILKISKILGLNPSNELEAMAFIFKAREKSVSNIIDVMITCDCGEINMIPVDIETLFFKDKEKLHTDIKIKLIQNFEDIVEIYPSILDLSLDDCSEIEKKFIHNNKIIFDNTISCNCRKCNAKLVTTIDYKNIISKFNIKNIYEQYIDLTQHTNMTKKDVDDMPPFEREIFLGLIQDKINKA
jgi:hypothetical protein